MTMKKILFLLCCLTLITSSVQAGTISNCVYFDDGALKPVLNLIDNAQCSIIIQMYNFTNTHTSEQSNSEVITHLLDKLKENPEKCIDLKILIDNQGANKPPEKGGKDYGFPEKAFEELIPGCIKWDSKSSTMHRKFAVVDSSVVFLGSTNWTQNGFHENREVDVLLYDAELAKQILDEFDKDWETALPDFPLKDKQPEQPLPPEFEEYYYGNNNPSSMIFHRPNCRHIKKPIDKDNYEKFQTRQEAIDKKYKPCGTCKP